MTGDFSAACFAQVQADGVQTCLTWGRTNTAFTGWSLARGVFGLPQHTHYELDIGTGSTDAGIAADNQGAAGTWYWLVMTRASGTFRLYVNALQQTTTYSGSYSTSSPTKVEIGYPVGTGAINPKVYLAYCAVWTTRALSGSEIAGIYAAL